MATLAVPIAVVGTMAQSQLRQGRLRRPRPGTVLQPQSDSLSFATASRTSTGGRPFSSSTGPYAYRRVFLLELAALPPEPLEEMEKLEQLRVLALGRRIQVGVVEHAGRGVDTPEDYQRFRGRQYRPAQLDQSVRDAWVLLRSRLDRICKQWRGQ